MLLFQAMNLKGDDIALRSADFYKSNDITVTTNTEVGFFFYICASLPPLILDPVVKITNYQYTVEP